MRRIRLRPATQRDLAEFRKIACGHHLIFYIVTDKLIDVVRILHERRDIDALASPLMTKAE